MTSYTIPEYYKGSSSYPSITKRLETANKLLADKRAESNDKSDACLLAVYHEFEEDSRDKPFYEDGLMTAILAGETVLSTLKEGEEAWRNVTMSLAALFVRRSRWDDRKHLGDLDHAIALVDHTLLGQDADASFRVTASRALSAMWEEKSERTRDENALRQALKHLETASAFAEPAERGVLLSSAACLRFRMDPSVLRSILEIPVHQLQSTRVSFSAGSRRKFRFIDARSLATETSLRVVEFDVLPRQRYVALSYVWRGSYIEGAEPPRLGTMAIEGAIGADPISIDVLVAVCKCIVAPQLDCDLLWIDGVCIIQNDEEDKGWQIQNMFDIYKHCKQCLILPGGLSRLVPLTEPTSWIHRAWTLQEAVAPEACMCLFAWTHGDAILQAHFPVGVVEVEPGKSARADLRSLLMMTLPGLCRIVAPGTSWQDAPKIELKILADKHEHSQAIALLGAIDHKGMEGMDNAVWRSSLTRVASRPADAVFSIMGLFDVNLNPLDFDPEDRKNPTIALMQAVLKAGRRAEWLGAAPNMELNAEIPTLPIFSTTGPQGRAVIPTANGDAPISDIMNDMWWRLEGAPRGEMRDDGALAIHVKTLPIRHLQQSDADLEIPLDGETWWDRKRLGAEVWCASPSQRGPPYVLQLGHKQRYLNAAVAMIVTPRPFLVMLVDHAGPGVVRNLGYTDVSQEVLDLEGWTEQTVVITPPRPAAAVA